jgi:hypothetical protein
MVQDTQEIWKLLRCSLSRWTKENREPEDLVQGAELVPKISWGRTIENQRRSLAYMLVSDRIIVLNKGSLSSDVLRRNEVMGFCVTHGT